MVPISIKDALLTDLSATLVASTTGCHDIHHCCTLSSVITTCLVIIFAATWIAVHRNIPGPMKGRLSVNLERLKLFFLTLLLPEWVLAWAVRQFLIARSMVPALESARISAQQRWGVHTSGNGDIERHRTEHDMELPFACKLPNSRLLNDAELCARATPCSGLR